MTLELFEKLLREQCKKSYIDLKNGKREIRLQKERDKVRAIKDLVKGEIDEEDLSDSCLRTFGNVLEETSNSYAKEMGAKIYSSKIGNIDIDNFWEYNGIMYDLESKANINLDKGKSRETKSELHDKTKVTRHSTRNDKQVISGIIVWTKPTEKDAQKLAKKTLQDTRMFGYIDFFNIFGIDIIEDDFKKMIRQVWMEEIKEYCKVKQQKIDWSI
jgi:hypothetical protein